MHAVSGLPLELTQLSYVSPKNVRYLLWSSVVGEKNNPLFPWRQCQGLRTQLEQARAGAFLTVGLNQQKGQQDANGWAVAFPGLRHLDSCTVGKKEK